MNQFIKAAFAIVGIASVTFGCGGSGVGPVKNPNIRYANSIPDSTAIDFSLNSVLVPSSLAFGASTANFITTKPGDYDVTITEHGQVQSLWSEADTFSLGNDYVVVSVGEEGFGSELAKRPQLVVSPIDRSVPNGTKARLIVVNAFDRMTGSNNAALDFANPGLNPDPWAISGLQFATQQTTQIDAGSQDIQARLAGSQLVFVEKTLNLAAGHIYLILITGIEGGSSAQAPDMKMIDIQTKTQ